MRYFKVKYEGTYSSKDENPSLDVKGDFPKEVEVYPNKTNTTKEIKESLGLHFAQIVGIEELSKEDLEEYYS